MFRKPELDADLEDPVDTEFEEPGVRRRFIRKVFAILSVQLLCTFGLVCIFVFYEPLRVYVYHNKMIFYISMGVGFALVLAIGCIESLRRKVPLNFFMLGLLTIAQSVFVGCVAAVTDPEKVLIAAGITVGVVVALTVFALQTKIDFTLCGTGLFILMLLLMVLGLVALFVPNKILFLVYCSLGALLISVYLIYDIQLMMGGKHAYSLSPEEYIFGAMNLYVDIINLFTYILGILMGSE